MSETYIDEEWKVSEDGRTAWVTGRRRRDHPWSLRWFFQNDLEPMPPAEYRPDDPHRVFKWYVRNPLQNFGRWVIGVCDRDYTVIGMAPVMATTWLDVPQDDERSKRCGLRRGWKWSVIKLGWLRLPFVSYVGKSGIIPMGVIKAIRGEGKVTWHPVLWYVGWSWWGFCGMKINILHSPVQVALSHEERAC